MREMQFASFRKSSLFFLCLLSSPSHLRREEHPGKEFEVVLFLNFRAEKRNKRARVLTVRQAPSLKKWWEFRRSCKQKKATNFVCFANIPGKQQHFNVTNGKASVLFS